MKNIINSTYIFLYRLRNKLLRELVSFLKLRPASRPYITGDGFRKMADHIYDETGKCVADKIKYGEIVFVKGDMLNEWFKNVHPQITSKYILITHNSDYNIKDSDLNFIDDKIIHWYAQNVIAKHTKLTPIPIGINNYYLYNLSSPRLYNKFRKTLSEQKNRIIFGFSVGTNIKERQPALDFLNGLKTADKIRGKNYPRTYMALIKKYKFIAAPNGNGLDDPRRWQALYFGIVPIVTKSEAMDYFKSLGLPFYIINNWEELNKFEENDLKELYEKLMSNKNDEPLFLDYWEKMIKNTKYE